MPLLGKSQATQLDSEIIPAEFVCPITQTIMLNPVTLICGHVFTDSALREWLQFNNDSCPNGCDLGPVPLVMKHVFLGARIHKYLELHPDLANDCKSSINVSNAIVNFFVRNNQDWNQDVPAIEEPGSCAPGGEMKSQVNSRASEMPKKEGDQRHQVGHEDELPFHSEMCIFNISTNHCQRKATNFGLHANADRIDSFHQALESQLNCKAISQAMYEQLKQILEIDDPKTDAKSNKKPREKLFCRIHADCHVKLRQDLFPGSNALNDLTAKQSNRLIEAFVQVLSMRIVVN
jgi:hypothetical protein